MVLFKVGRGNADELYQSSGSTNDEGIHNDPTSFNDAREPHAVRLDATATIDPSQVTAYSGTKGMHLTEYLPASAGNERSVSGV